MEVVAGALPNLLLKLAELIYGEYNLQKGVKVGIIFLQFELESMQGALEEMAKSPADQLRNHDKIWARNMRELSYDIEDKIDTYMIQRKAKQQTVFKTIIDRSLELLMQPKIRHTIAIDIEDIKSRVKEVAKQRNRFMVTNHIVKPVIIDPRLLAQYEKATNLVGINEAKEEVIKILMDENDLAKQQDKIVSIVGFGGLGKTTLAKAVYEELRAKFDRSAFVSVSQTPNIDTLLMDVLSQFGKKNIGSINVINQLREFLTNKR
ncbi:hypothetical protein HU200_048972 [Digitaria exilis]|uniref:Uncharacterized protein n=1 Tax=Digitaria exilis TaxID=1010633 RepID=A0A835B5S1_9POAL|nr:hypothetical protein HU200_048972 [Digitaria exilis]